MERSESIKELVTALVKFQTTVGKIKKDSNNPFFKSKYAALPDILDSIHQPLIECGLTVNQFPTGNNGLTTILAHTSGEYLMDTYFMTPSKNDPQGVGSCITYQRRYALGGVLNLNIDEDDDGNAASRPPVARPTNNTPTPKAPVAPKQIAEPSVDERAANMLGTKKAEPLTEAQLKAHAERIKLLDTATACAKYYNALTADLKENEDLKKLLASQRDSLVVKKEAA